MNFDLERARRETPGAANVLHFNNAGASLMPQPVLDATIGYLQLEGQIGGYEAARQEAARAERMYGAAARMLNCGPDEIAFVENATRAWDMAFYSLARSFRPGDRILTAQAEYASNYLALLQVARQSGVTVEVVPNDPDGQIDLEALRNALDERVKLIALTHVPTNGGLVNPAQAVGQIARQAGVLYLLDACQSVGQMKVDVAALGCDFLSLTGRKFLRGPRGTGLLYARREVIEQIEPVFLDLHSARWVSLDEYEVRPDARRFENWESNLAGKIGLGVALDYALGWGLEAIEERVTALAARLRERLGDLKGVQVRDQGRHQCGIVTFSVEGHEVASVQQRLAERRINVSLSLPEYARLDAETRQLPPLLRASVHYYNSEEEIERFCDELNTLIAG